MSSTLLDIINGPQTTGLRSYGVRCSWQYGIISPIDHNAPLISEAHMKGIHSKLDKMPLKFGDSATWITQFLRGILNSKDSYRVVEETRTLLDIGRSSIKKLEFQPYYIVPTIGVDFQEEISVKATIKTAITTQVPLKGLTKVIYVSSLDLYIKEITNSKAQKYIDSYPFSRIDAIEADRAAVGPSVQEKDLPAGIPAPVIGPHKGRVSHQ
ncbi:TPA_asm: M [Ipomoea betacytorhabdovirus 1]|nr:TPA_asm: M [Ipomoea betacytorhabdovirus 1]